MEDGALEEEASFGVEDGAGGASWGGIFASGVGAAFAFFPVVGVGAVDEVAVMSFFGVVVEAISFAPAAVPVGAEHGGGGGGGLVLVFFVPAGGLRACHGFTPLLASPVPLRT